MADNKISALTSYTNPDRVNDSLPIVDSANSVTKRISVNNMLGLTSAPVSTGDTQTLTAKTLTAPAINGATLSGTLSGTYTIGGTPTFPASVVTLTGSQTLTNKILTSPTINAPTLTNASITQDAVTGFTSANSGTVYGIAVTSSTFSGTAITAGTVGSTQVAAGVVVQVVNTTFGAVATGTTTIPFDDTIPQNTEGDQYMTQAITPKSATNILVIDVIFFGSISIGNDLIMALFQDSTANALAATSFFNATATARDILTLRYTMTAGTTSATTFKVRAGPPTAGTTTFNGNSSARLFGTVPKSSITVWEYKV